MAEVTTVMCVPDLPRLAIVDDDLTPDERHLLVHRELMTVRMEQRYRQVMRIEVLARVIHGSDHYERETLLIGTVDGVVRQVAHLRVALREAGPARDEILEGLLPFGTVLTRHAMQVEQDNLELFQTTPTPVLRARLSSSRAILHGRHYVLRMPTGAVLASVTEILP